MFICDKIACYIRCKSVYFGLRFLKVSSLNFRFKLLEYPPAIRYLHTRLFFASSSTFKSKSECKNFKYKSAVLGIFSTSLEARAGMCDVFLKYLVEFALPDESTNLLT